MNKLKVVLLALTVLCQQAVGQSDTSYSDSSRYQVSVFTPLFLDSAFDGEMNYRYGKNFPKFINAGLEFYEGVQLAIDSLNKEGIDLDVHIYDTRSSGSTITNVLTTPEFNETDLIIGHINASEARLLAAEAAKKNVPFINVNYPNDAGITNNPNYIIMNSTLTTHCAAMYKFLQRNFSLSTITVFTKNGTQEEKLKSYFTDIEKNTSSAPLKLRYVTLDNNFTPEQLTKYLDSDLTNVCIAGSLDLNFGQKLAQGLALMNETYATTLFGMPTWDGIDFTKPEYKNLEIYYSTPFYINPNDKLSENVKQVFQAGFYSRPSDMVYRGFETMYHFAHLLKLHGKNLSGSLSDKRFKLFTDFDIQPVLDPKTMTLDYFENKKIHFIKKIDGEIRANY